MRDVEAESIDGKRKNETLWPVMRISHTRSRCRFSLALSIPQLTTLIRYLRSVLQAQANIESECRLYISVHL